MMTAVHPAARSWMAAGRSGDARGFREGDLALVAAIALQILEFSYAYPATVLKICLVSICTFPPGNLSARTVCLSVLR